ncbi:MAG: bifunctional phosphoribosyl-AMP cyclohydrolase/phosphoribosyl-ATP diphosphatase HisIE [Syntrophomonadaceae bacterium]|jgi:phosphoribosyl-ATP pyrophosphohydrolase/phosphoribosyl-AMP cyclohydrolase|nr:bifunctional phosphoribosyl-AMP cyclohydrolase/phosphoribosyl-ATP diphosphatase HisIE [Syntrophomonadaceae bacterium]
MMNKMNFDKQGGLIPAIIQDAISGQVLMLAYMNKEALAKTIETGNTWFYSRSRQELWLKGESSGHVQTVKEILYDCDEDALLIKVEQTGVACHTGHYSCFYRNWEGQEVEKQIFDLDKVYAFPASSPAILYELYDVIKDRQAKLPEGAYTTYLFQKGLDKILKKVGEENAEVIIAAKNREKSEVIYETSDLLYHLMVLLVEQDVSLDEIFSELKSRR